MSEQKNEKGALVPRLRFPEFREAGEWEDVPIESILEVRDERRVPSTAAPLYSLTIESGITEKTDRYNREFLVRDAGNKKYKLVEPKDIVYNPSNLRWGAINYSQLSHSVVVSPIYEVLSLGDNSENYLEFIACSVMRDQQIRRFITKAQGTLVERIAVKIEDFLSTRLPVPTTRAEQQKIADCLSSLDELIAAESQKLTTLKTHKKGLMQQLFPREGETVPRLRFPEFREAGEWENKSLGEVCDVLQGYGFPEALQGRTKGKYPFCKVSDISRAVAENGGILVEAANYVGDDELSKLRAKPIPPGTTVFAKIGEALRLNRRAFVQTECLIDNNAVGLKAIHGCADDYFVYLLSQLIDLNKHCGGAVPSVNKSTLEAIEVVVPKPKEQKQIAASLSSLDDLITAQTQKIAALKTHKKGLMQQLFPVLDEVQP
ncbi:restriction endonuclease subunit S [Caldimonas thermodepolymerans]|uniref:restriction endonuclease subunit S n=1 Tax=Caldimonas thermodepolymerans TaxID=215580 RepID=UPI0010518744|nr:restriction endonuclease subunit S [Caldimonas thermodepolymerans]UZG49512.1 restriction endonuclease subunit S [Caldimonas thermodepolymerans]